MIDRGNVRWDKAGVATTTLLLKKLLAFYGNRSLIFLSKTTCQLLLSGARLFQSTMFLSISQFLNIFEEM
jgi:hypothetical protein